MIGALHRLIGRESPRARELAELPLFAAVPRAQLVYLAAHLDEVRIEAGETLIREGHRNRAFWVLLDGEVEVSTANVLHHTLRRGDFFGVTSMLDGCPARATAWTRTSIRALVAGPAQFRAFKGNDTVAARLRSTARRPVMADGRAA